MPPTVYNGFKNTTDIYISANSTTVPLARRTGKGGTKDKARDNQTRHARHGNETRTNDKTRQDKLQDKTRQDKTKQDETRQSKTR